MPGTSETEHLGAVAVGGEHLDELGVLFTVGVGDGLEYDAQVVRELTGELLETELESAWRDAGMAVPRHLPTPA